MSFPRPGITHSDVARSNYTPGRSAPISQITFHHIVGDAAVALKMWKDPKREGSSNFVIGSNGAIFSAVPEADTAWCDGSRASNARTLSIEHAGGHPSVAYTEAMYEASAHLCAYLIDKYGISNFKRHREVSESPTACPGGLDVERIIARAHALIAQSKAPPPAPPPPPPVRSVQYERLPQPLDLQYNKDGNVWGLNAARWPDFKPVGHFRKGDRLQAVGIMHHSLGGNYYMGATDFGQADITGRPSFNYGVNVVDTEPYVAPATPVPDPVPTPAPTPPVTTPAPVPVPPASEPIREITPVSGPEQTPPAQQPSTQVNLLRRVIQFILHLLKFRI